MRCPCYPALLAQECPPAIAFSDRNGKISKDEAVKRMGEKDADELFKLAGALPRYAPLCVSGTHLHTCVPDHDGDGELTISEYQNAVAYREAITTPTLARPTAPRRPPPSVRRRWRAVQTARTDGQLYAPTVVRTDGKLYGIRE